nr:hypothetical protein 2 (7 aa) - Bacillus stearothermophilus [Geobacillus stearothermophilus]CAA27782.1 unnamed protein product [Geobacillus stearothermophilus]
MANVFGT